ncbi:zinc finger protein 658B-like [Contarinia nasturtii]|uniref:zinc finger protein 658B-like n=1 Tax=Contarinia nasturtii TaxID=265458 RepID=UPI0012D4BEDF|nr:zinc finger protein 658B-like [Contarinia nasturtii]
MVLTYEQTERACGFLLLNEVNVFTYCCKMCGYEFGFGTELEEHILREHQNVKSCIENVFVPGGNFESILDDVDQKLMTVNEIKQEIDMESTKLQESDFRNTVQSSGFSSVFVNEVNYEMYENELVEVKTDDSKVQKSKNRKSPKGRPIKVHKITNKVTKTPQIDPNKYYCDMCPFNEVNFTLKTDLMKHMRGHNTAKKPKPCPICSEMTQNVMKHVRAKHQELNGKPYKCNYCERRFPTEYSQMNHIRTHTGERPFLCADCGSAFKTSNALKVHIDKIHKSGKIMPYSCTDCDLSFLLRNKFEHHRLSVHSDPRPYVCDVCQDRFKSQSTLRSHKFIHGERTSTCKFCQKKFKTNDYKRYHERKVHGDIYRGNERRYQSHEGDF